MVADGWSAVRPPVVQSTWHSRQPATSTDTLPQSSDFNRGACRLLGMSKPPSRIENLATIAMEQPAHYIANRLPKKRNIQVEIPIAFRFFYRIDIQQSITTLAVFAEFS